MRPPQRRIGSVAACLAVASATLGACGAAPTPAGPPIAVTTTLYPLAQVVEAIGGPAVRVTDLTEAGQDPRQLAATPALRTAAVDVEVGGGFQPALEQTSTPAPRVVTLAPQFGPGADGPWLDPVTMQAALPVIADALSAADPKASGRFADGRRDLYEQLASVSSEYQDTLSACNHDQIAAPGPTLTDVARRYHLKLHQLGTYPDPSPALVTSGAGAVGGAGISNVLTLPWVSDATARAAARQASVGTKAFDTAEAPPAGGWPKGTTYVGLLDKGLATLASALGCPSSTDTQ